MATIDLTPSGVSASFPAGAGRSVTVMDFYVSGAEAVAIKGSALANGDVIQLMDVAPGTILRSGGIEVITIDSDGSSDALADLGTGANADAFTDAAALDTLGFAAIGAGGDIVANAIRVEAADTLDLVLGQAVSFSSNDDWVVRIYIEMVDVSARPEPAAARDNP